MDEAPVAHQRGSLRADRLHSLAQQADRGDRRDEYPDAAQSADAQPGRIHRSLPRQNALNAMKSLLISAITLLLLATAAAQNNMPLLEEKSTRVSEHVYAIVGFPNVAIVVGSRATLVVDTGLGPRNGATVMRVVKKLSTNQKLFLTTTHFHVEHTAGETGFPAETTIIRPTVQQEEVEKGIVGMIARFSTFSEQNRE